VGEFSFFFLNSALTENLLQIQLPLNRHFTIKASTFQAPVYLPAQGRTGERVHDLGIAPVSRQTLLGTEPFSPL